MTNFRRRLLTHSLYKVDTGYEDFEVNEWFQQVTITAYEDTNNDSLPDHLVIGETCGGSHEKLNFEIKNLIVGQKYKLSFDEWTNAYLHSLIQPTWTYACAISPTKITDKSPGQPLFSGLPWYNFTNTIGQNHSVTIEFTATANIMYWAWDFGALADGVRFKHKVDNVKLELVPPTFNLKNVVTKQGTGVYELVSAVNNDYVNFNYTGNSGVEVIYYNITDLTKDATYRFTFSESYHGELLSSTYQYGCAITGVLPSPETSKPVNCAVVFDSVNTSGSRQATISFKPTTTAGYWIWDFGRLVDGVKNPNTFKIIKLEILAPDGTYKTLIE